MSAKKIQEIEELIIKIALEIAKSGEGCLFVIGEDVKYESLIKKKFTKLNIFEKGAEKILKGLAVIDGAIVLDRKGNLIAYGALIKNTKAFIGFGTRHAAALTASREGRISILASEEERKVKVFKDGKYIMQIDALQKDVKKSASTASKILESTGAGFIGTLGAATLAPTIGVALLPGIIIFGGSYFAIRALLERFGK
jgi:DNA integrity scanning protein DisA with diadenylate cyclase activity